MTVMVAMKADVSQENTSRVPNFIRTFFPIVLIWAANFLGVTTFKSEFEDRGLEYWMTFPQGAGERLARKAAPRFMLLLFLIAVYVVLHLSFPRDRFSDSFSPAFFGPCSILIFVNGFLCGFLNERNLRMVANVLTFFSISALSFGLSSIALAFFPGKEHLSVFIVSIFAMLIVISILGGILISSGRKFDLRFPDLFLKRVRAVGLPLFLVLDIAALVFHFAGRRT